MSDLGYIVLPLTVIIWLLLRLRKDKYPRFRFLGDRSWSRQANYTFVDGLVFIVVLAGVYILVILIQWTWRHL